MECLVQWPNGTVIHHENLNFILFPEDYEKAQDDFSKDRKYVWWPTFALIIDLVFCFPLQFIHFWVSALSSWGLEPVALRTGLYAIGSADSPLITPSFVSVVEILWSLKTWQISDMPSFSQEVYLKQVFSITWRLNTREAGLRLRNISNYSNALAFMYIVLVIMSLFESDLAML